jgi:hypothetical protein
MDVSATRGSVGLSSGRAAKVSSRGGKVSPPESNESESVKVGWVIGIPPSNLCCFVNIITD